MTVFKIQVKRESNPPRHFNVVAEKTQDAVKIAALQLREEGITDAKGIEVIGKTSSLRD